MEHLADSAKQRTGICFEEDRVAREAQLGSFIVGCWELRSWFSLGDGRY
jgi:hypothetical protein